MDFPAGIFTHFDKTSPSSGPQIAPWLLICCASQSSANITCYITHSTCELSDIVNVLNESWLLLFCRYVLKELIETEKLYVADLGLIVEVSFFWGLGGLSLKYLLTNHMWIWSTLLWNTISFPVILEWFECISEHLITAELDLIYQLTRFPLSCNTDHSTN